MAEKKRAGAKNSPLPLPFAPPSSIVPVPPASPSSTSPSQPETGVGEKIIFSRWRLMREMVLFRMRPIGTIFKIHFIRSSNIQQRGENIDNETVGKDRRHSNNGPDGRA